MQVRRYPQPQVGSLGPAGATPAGAGCWDSTPKPQHPPGYSLEEEQQVRWEAAEIGRQVLGSEEPGQAGELGTETGLVNAKEGRVPPVPAGTTRHPWHPPALWGLQPPPALPTWALLSSLGSLCNPRANARMSAAGGSLVGMHGNSTGSEGGSLQGWEVAVQHPPELPKIPWRANPLVPLALSKAVCGQWE